MSRLLETKDIYFACYYDFKTRKATLVPFSLRKDNTREYTIKVSLLGEYTGINIDASLNADTPEQSDLVDLDNALKNVIYNRVVEPNGNPSEQCILSYGEVLDLYFDNRTNLSWVYVEKCKLNHCHKTLDENGYGYDLVKEEKIPYLTKLYSDKLSADYKKLIKTKLIADLVVELKNIVEDYSSDTPLHRRNRNLRDERRDVTLGGVDKIINNTEEYVIHEDEEYQMR